MIKRNAFFFACNQRFLFTFCIALMSLKKNSPKALENADVFLFHQGLTGEDFALVNKIHPCKFVEYTFAVETNFQHINITKNSQLTFARYEIFDMLDEYSKVLYMDVDLMITGELEPIFRDYGNKGGIAMAKDTQKGYTLITKNFNVPMKEYDMTVPCYNAGVTLFCDNIKSREKLRMWCYQKTAEWLENIICPDQAIVNIMLQEFGIEIEVLPDEYNCTPSNYKYFDKTANVCVMHCAGHGVRFWRYSYNSEWEKLYAEYLTLADNALPYTDIDKPWRLLIKKHKLYKYDFFNKSPNPHVHPAKFIKYLLTYPYYYFFQRNRCR